MPDVCKCGAPAHATDPERCAAGHLVTHNAAAFKHGQWAVERGAGGGVPADLRMSVEAFREQVIRDKGGLNGLSALKVAYIRRLCELETLSQLLTANLAQHGIFTRKQRVRTVFSKLLAVLDRWDRYAVRVGVERKARPVSLAEVMADGE